MTSPSSQDIRASLTELGDEEAIDIMEGRVLPSEEAVDQAAQQFARRLLAEPDSTPAEQVERATVVQLINRQPWMRMAAALMLGVLISSMLTTRTQFPDAGSSMASANVVYLEVVRSASTEVPEVARDGEPWVTLFAYPDFPEAELYRVYVERAQGSEQQPASWLAVLEQRIPAGTRESLVVNLRSEDLEAGTYRLRIEAESEGVWLGSTNLPFRIPDAGG